jgi:hypothetical protein
MYVYVLLFNARTENEGIHTLKINDRNIVLAFEAEDDATRYGLLLEAQDFASPSVEQFELEDIVEFCQGANYEYKLVPDGTLAVPPEGNVEQTDWQLDAQPNRAASESSELSKSDLSKSELDQIRRRLEGLL